MSYLCLLVYLFCTFIRPQDWVPMFFGMRLVNTFSLMAIFFLIMERMAAKGTVIAKVPQNKFMFGLFFAALTSHVVHTYLEGLIFTFNGFIILFMLFFLTLNGLNSDTKLKIAIWFIVLMVLVMVPQGVYQLEHGYGWAGQKITFDFHRDEYRINWIGIFNDPNDLALIFVVAVGVVLPFIFGKNPFFIRLINMAMLGTFTYGIYLTNSRGGLLALMTTVFFFFVRLTKKFMLGGIIGGILAALILVLGPSRAGIISSQEASANARIELWYGGILMMKSNPLFGVGYNMFMEDMPQTAHNSYILIGAELGFFGLFFWMALIYSSIKGLTLVQLHDEKLRKYALGVQSGLVGFCAAAFFVSRSYVILPYLLFALSGAIMVVAASRDERCNYVFTKKDAKNTCGLTFGIILLAYILIKVGI